MNVVSVISSNVVSPSNILKAVEGSASENIDILASEETVLISAEGMQLVEDEINQKGNGSGTEPKTKEDESGTSGSSTKGNGSGTEPG